jgi:hypothetical protein
MLTPTVIEVRRLSAHRTDGGDAMIAAAQLPPLGAGPARRRREPPFRSRTAGGAPAPTRSRTGSRSFADFI